MNHTIIKGIKCLVLQCMTATVCVMAITACFHESKVKPMVDTATKITDDNYLRDSLRHASMETDIKASKERFRLERKAKAEGERND